jgi:haloacid dehalogenase superfamily, subfamily IA, variant 3 with third motif having DD or ED
MVFGCIFDWDGVISDSSEHHIEAWKMLAREEDLVFPEHLFKRSFGMKNEQIIPQLFEWTTDMTEIRRLDKRKEQLYREIVMKNGALTFPGVGPFLAMLREFDIPCVIGSSAPRANIATALEKLGFSDFFKSIVCGEDVQFGKPDPQIFLTAARNLEIPPHQCIVFEDAHVGISAARAGGMKVVAVTTTYPRASLAEADCIVDRLDELNLPRLRQLFDL